MKRKFDKKKNTKLIIPYIDLDSHWAYTTEPDETTVSFLSGRELEVVNLSLRFPKPFALHEHNFLKAFRNGEYLNP